MIARKLSGSAIAFGADCRNSFSMSETSGASHRVEEKFSLPLFLFTVAAWDSNCPQHIPQRFEAADVAVALNSRDRRIAELEAEVTRLKGAAK